ncbi:MAG: adenylate/guanylate cyclase domain-containing protein [Proteobacteria bacterium]|nr:adenylate/guanylate cyclase domain-containing protein [Pseudomonadota bacterium]
MADGAEVVILFADIAGSTRLYERLGDVRARNTVARCVGTMADIAQRHAGRVVKTIGDEAMCLFDDADRATAAAIEMQDAITANGIGLDHAVAIRVGFHLGPVITDAADVFGDTVNVAAHASKQAKPGQIVITDAALAGITPKWRPETRAVGLMNLKGKQDQTELFEVVWRAEDMTMLQVMPGAAAQPRGSRLGLRIGQTRVELGPNRPLFTLGRDERNDAVVAEATVSRHHARVEFQNGRFLLTDQSANGTYVVPDSGERVFLRRESAVLEGKGVLGLGAPPSEGSLATIGYEAG